MDDRYEAFFEMHVRYQLKNTLVQMGPEINSQQALFIQECIEAAKASPEERTVNIIKDVHTRFRIKADNNRT